jgi:hypothetical protein
MQASFLLDLLCDQDVEMVVSGGRCFWCCLLSDVLDLKLVACIFFLVFKVSKLSQRSSRPRTVCLMGHRKLFFFAFFFAPCRVYISIDVLCNPFGTHSFIEKWPAVVTDVIILILQHTWLAVCQYISFG